MTLLLAGHETTANALTWTWYELGATPDVLARLVDELARARRPPDHRRRSADAAVEPRGDRGGDAPASAGVHDRPRGARAGRRSAATACPTGSIVAVNIRGIHRRADYYPAPLAFLPERMLPDAKKARPRHHYLPFGAGPRVCIGSHFALLEAQLALATMVQRARAPAARRRTSSPSRWSRCARAAGCRRSSSVRVSDATAGTARAARATGSSHASARPQIR